MVWLKPIRCPALSVAGASGGLVASATAPIAHSASPKDGGKGIFKVDPFQSVDQEGVGLQVKMGIEKGRKARKDLKVGICGEHGGEAASVKFCHKVGMNYVSCSPYRVPIARLAAAQAVTAEKTK